MTTITVMCPQCATPITVYVITERPRAVLCPACPGDTVPLVPVPQEDS